MTNARSIFRSCIPLCLTILGLSACGGGSGSSAPSPPPPPPPDTTAPTVSDVQAPAGTSVNRTVTLSATASDNTGVTEVRFFADGNLIGSDDSDPYSVDWDTSMETDGDHVLTVEAEDAAGNVATSGDVTVTVRNMAQFAVAPSGAEENPPVQSAGTASVDLTANLATGDLQGTVTVSGIAPTAAHIHDAFAGHNGPVFVDLEQDAGDPSVFTVPAGTTLDTAGVDRLLAGALYVNVHSAANPGGELRGQILSEDLVLRFSDLTGRSSVPEVDTIASGRAAATLNVVTGALVVQARAENLDDATQAHVHDAYAGATGPVAVGLEQDPMDLGRWFVEDGVLNTEGLAAFAAGRLYVNVHSPANPGGEIRGQILPEGISVLFTELAGEQEVPAVDTNADGLAALTFDAANALLTIHVNTSGLGDANGAHLHGAFGGVDGPVEIGLTQDGSDPGHWFAEEQSLGQAQLDAFQAGATYVNVHSPAHPGGEIRGQVIPEGIVFAFGHLEGRQEVPAVASMAGGTFAVTVDPTAMVLVAHANTTGADDAVAAHLHDNYAGSNGPVAIGLTQDAVEVSRWSAVDEPLSADQLAAIHAGRYYVNIHTPTNPGGEIRGQVAPPPVEVLFTDVSGAEEVPAVASAATGLVASTVDRDSGVLTLHLRASGADDATAAHIHQAYAGQNGPVLVGLTQDLLDAGHWSVIEEQLDADGLAEYVSGRLYVNLHTPANPGGELRGQIAPQDIRVIFSAMSGDQVIPAVMTAASGVSASTANLATRRLAVFVNAAGVDDATSAGVHVGGAAENGAEILPLQQTPMLVSQWSGVTEPLAADDYSAFRAGRLYVQVATPANPNGEVRGQIVPDDAAEFDDQPPTVALTSPGDPVSGTVTLEADASDDQGVVEVRFLVDGVLIDTDTIAPYSIDWDTTGFSNGQVTLTAEAEDQAGNVGTSADVVTTIENAAAVTLTQIQNEVFTPTCSGCHSGPTSNNLPSGMNLSSAADSHDALVNVASIQVPELDRVEPTNPDNSYLIQKLEGTAAVGTRMPQGGPFLDQATVDTIRQWIMDGAPNN